MTAENTRPQDAPGEDDLRARYLPVSRRELRRRREAGTLAPRPSGSSPDIEKPSETQTPETQTPEEQSHQGRSADDVAALPAESRAVLSQDGLTELRELNEAVAASDDPDHVDPELLKKQQALAARAMQANQERIRQEQTESGRDVKEGQRPARAESEVITRKTLRAHMESDAPAESPEHAPASIEPIQARGAHGLELDAMVEHSTRQGAQQSMMGWLVIILAVLLIIAVAVVLSFIL